MRPASAGLMVIVKYTFTLPSYSKNSNQIWSSSLTFAVTKAYPKQNLEGDSPFYRKNDEDDVASWFIPKAFGTNHYCLSLTPFEGEGNLIILPNNACPRGKRAEAEVDWKKHRTSWNSMTNVSMSEGNIMNKTQQDSDK